MTPLVNDPLSTKILTTRSLNLYHKMNSKWSPENNKPVANLPYRAPPGLVAIALGHAPRPPNHVVRDPPTDRLLSDQISPIHRPPMPTQPDDARPMITNILPNLNNNRPSDAPITRPPQAPHNSRPTNSPVSELFSRNINKQSWRTPFITSPFPTPPPVTRDLWTLT